MSVNLRQNRCLKKYYNTVFNANPSVSIDTVNYNLLVDVFCSKPFRKYSDERYKKRRKKPLAEHRFKIKF